MTMTQRIRAVVSLAALAGCVLALAPLAEAQHYQQTNLVSDQVGTVTTDGHLVNPWGLSRSSTSPWWVANNGTGSSTLYNGAGVQSALVVTIPTTDGSGTGVPTGTVYNGTPDFQLAPGLNARFLFVTEDGTISGWNPAVNATEAVVMVREDAAVFKGVAIASANGANYLYVANFGRSRIEVFDTSFQRVRFRHDAFEDERLPRGYAPFNVQNIGGDLYVAFAKVDPGSHDEIAGEGRGFVDVFSPGGRLLRRLQHGPWLNAPWGMALAPGDFGKFSHHLLVGQFGSGQIAAYDMASGAFVDVMRDPSDAVLQIPGLWDISFGNGGNAGPLNSLYFTAGPDDESHGLFGNLTAIPAEQLLGNGL